MTDDSTPTDGARPLSDLHPLEAAAQRGREFNERLVSTARAAGISTVDAYEQAVKRLTDAEEKMVDTSRGDWLSTLTHAHVGLVRDVSTAFADATRSLIG